MNRRNFLTGFIFPFFKIEKSDDAPIATYPVIKKRDYCSGKTIKCSRCNSDVESVENIIIEAIWERSGYRKYVPSKFNIIHPCGCLIERNTNPVVIHEHR